MSYFSASQIAEARRMFALDPYLAHLNHGSVGAVPELVRQRQRELMDEMEHDPRKFLATMHERLAKTRIEVCRLISAPVDGSAFVANATTGVAIALNALDFHKGDEIVTTNHGYPSVAFNINQVVERYGAMHKNVDLPVTPTDDEVVDTIIQAVTSRTKLVVIDQITSATARCFPVVELVKRLKQLDIPVLVDAAHVPGQLDVNVEEIDADFWIANVHKWAFAPRGTGLIVASSKHRSRMRPLVASYGELVGYPTAVEFYGTGDYTGWLAASAGIDLIDSWGLTKLIQHNRQLIEYGQSVIADQIGVAVEDPGPGPLSMRLIPLPAGVAETKESADALHANIRSALRSEVTVSSFEGAGYLRVAAQIYNDAAEYEQLAIGLERLLAS